MIDGGAVAHAPGAVEAVPALGFGERATDPVQADPLGAEEELVERFGVDQVRVAVRDPGGPL